jgi:hypothetical protein
MAEKDDNKKDTENRLSQPTKKQDDETKQKFFLHIQKLENNVKDLEQKLDLANEQNKQILIAQKQNQKHLETLIKTQLVKKRNIDDEDSASARLLEEEYKESRKISNKRDNTLTSMWKTLNTPITELWEKVKSFTDDAPNWKLDVFINLSEKLSMLAVRGVGWFLDSTLGKLFSFFGANSKILSNFVTKVAQSAWDIVKWVYDFAKKTLQFIWDKFVMLAKVGWKILSIAWEILSTPVNIVYDIFKEVLMAILTSPIGFVMASVTFVLAMRYIVTTLWPDMKDFFKRIALSTWDWLKNTVADLFFKGNTSEMQVFFAKQKESIINFVKDIGGMVVTFYDKYVGEKVGLDSKRIMSFFSTNTGLFSNLWNSTVNLINKIYKNNILDEIQFTWNALRSIYDYIEYYVDDVDMLPEEKRYQEALKKENEERISAAYSSTLNTYAASLLQQKLLEEYLKNSLLPSEDLKTLLMNRGESILENIKSSKLFDSHIYGENFHDKIINALDTSILDKVVTDIVDNREKYKKEDVEKYEKATNLSKLKLAQLSEIIKDVDPGSVQKLITSFKEKTDKEYTEQLNKLFKSQDLEIYETTIDLGNGILKTLTVMEETNNEGKLKLISAYEKTSQKIIDNMQTAIEKVLSDITRTKITSRKELFEHVKKSYPDWSTEDVEKWVDQIFQISISESQKQLAKSEFGSVVRGPVPVLVGEGNYPEIIVPINNRGIDFIKDSMGDVIGNLDVKEEDKYKKEEASNFIKRIVKSQPKKDVKLYDLKNLSNTVVMIG